MIRTENITCKNGVIQIYTFSDENFKIIQTETGLVFEEAYDNAPCQFTYIESGEKINGENDN